MDDQADVRLLVDVRDDAADANRIAARTFILGERANRADGREGRQPGRRRLGARRGGCGQNHRRERENQRRKGSPAAHGGIVAREKAEGMEVELNLR